MLRAWRDSPARLREDANTEEDLRLGGYRDRVFVELLQNAVDAGADRVSIDVVDGELRVANTGRPLTAEGVQSLATLRASTKRDDESIGHFGVGFAAVLAITDEPVVLSEDASVRFSLSATRAEIGALGAGLAAPPPVLRLPWPVPQRELGQWTTMVCLPLRADVDAKALLATAREEAADLVLALPGLRELTVGETVFEVERGDWVTITCGDSRRRWRTLRRDGELSEVDSATLGAEQSRRWSLTWALPVDEDGVPIPHEPDVLHAPTPSDERLSLPARLLATVAMEPSRRRVRPGAATDAVLRAAAAAYPELLASVAPQHRLDLAPPPGFPLSEVDSLLRAEILRACRLAPLWPASRPVAAADAVVIERATDALVAALADTIDGLLPAEFARSRYGAVVRELGMTRLSIAELVDRVLGVEREPSWWARFYAALAEIVDGGVDADELGALPIPLWDGRILPGARGKVVLSAEVELPVGLELPVVHPNAVHPLLLRLGARQIDAADVVDLPEVRDAVDRSVADAEAGLDTSALVDFVLRSVDADARPWLGALALRGVDGDVRRADELVLPDAAVLTVFDPEAVGVDGPLEVVAPEFVRSYERSALTALGVLDGFAVVVDDEPTTPDHDLPDESTWWETVTPQRIHALRDLDLIADDRWPQALDLLANDPAAWRALSEHGGHASWWISRNAVLADAAPNQWRDPEAVALSGLFDPIPVTLPEPIRRAIGVRHELRVADTEDATELLTRLADPARSIPDSVVLQANATVARAHREGLLALDDLPQLEAVRTADGVRTDAVVLDQPWLLAALAPQEVVLVDFALAPALAEVLDLPLASEVLDVLVEGDGDEVAFGALPAVVEVCALAGVAVPEGVVTLHDSLRVQVDGENVATSWCVADGVLHAEDTERGLALALAWGSGQWPARDLLVRLLAEPDARTLLT